MFNMFGKPFKDVDSWLLISVMDKYAMIMQHVILCNLHTHFLVLVQCFCDGV